ncbi:hypothetical protein ARMGADRAFT_297072 [Armillaria gallica]|uniref:Uncharacterized protein n=1 Tax=Armillaria gallica TaxID=47427 RepID=A0A2H3D8G3_ARMGA|nr:hypothetical protein ARMGADRAFT_297072 [Armillaria gallica]
MILWLDLFSDLTFHLRLHYRFRSHLAFLFYLILLIHRIVDTHPHQLLQFNFFYFVVMEPLFIMIYIHVERNCFFSSLRQHQGAVRSAHYRSGTMAPDNEKRVSYVAVNLICFILPQVTCDYIALINAPRHGREYTSERVLSPRMQIRYLSSSLVSWRCTSANCKKTIEEPLF